MTTYTCHWRELAHADGADPQLVRLSLTPHGHAGRSDWRHEQAPVSARQFATVDTCEGEPEEGPRALLQRLLALRATLAQRGFQEIVPSSRLYAPRDLEDYRAKTDDECWMDLAMLHTECGDHVQALAALQQCRDSAQTWYWHTVARRLHAHHARGLADPEADEVWAAALEHAGFILARAAEQGGAAYRMSTGGAGYSFGDRYDGAAPQLAGAAQTVAEYLLCIAGEPEQALQMIEVAETTGYANTRLREFQVAALLQLGRHAEAYPIHRNWRLQMPEVMEQAAYRAFLEQEQAQRREAERQRIAGLRFAYEEGVPASPAELQQLRERFPAALEVSAAYRCLLGESGQPRALSVIDGEQRQRYALFTVAQALVKHEDFIGWLHMHDDSSPEFAQDIHRAIAESGIEPLHMLPIVGDEDASDCFMLRTNGPDAGAVYFWSHEEYAVFVPIVDDVAQLFPWLRAEAESGNTFSL
ncbi:hypothetical protein [Xanthomonas medicagonis]|uniref:hypothetical protein n=1 Tax=Xanthomonas medicagonis TaxID=3160841 RepID=UPI003513DC6E